MSMKRKVLFFAALAMTLGYSGKAQAADTINADAHATIVTPLSITNTGGTGLEFGSIAAGSTLGTVSVSASDAVSHTGGITVLTTDQSAAIFGVTGTGTHAYTVTTPATCTLTGDGGGTMTVDDWVITGGSWSRALVGGADAFKIGGTLNVAANQLQGSYTGSFAVAVAYN